MLLELLSQLQVGLPLPREHPVRIKVDELGYGDLGGAALPLPDELVRVEEERRRTVPAAHVLLLLRLWGLVVLGCGRGFVVQLLG